MPVIDARGRLFGRFNIIDAVVVAVVLLAIPAVYAAYLLFRVPAPVVDTVEPASLKITDTLRVRMTGRNLLPYLTAYVGRSGEPVSVFLDDRQSSLARFLIESPTSASLDLPKLRPGTYDIYLYSEGQQLLHHVKAFTIEPNGPPDPQPGGPDLRRSVADVRVYYVVPKPSASRPRVGDRDTFGSPTLSGEPDARLTALSVEGAASAAPVPNSVLLVADVRVPVSLTDQGLWWYKGQRVRPGEHLAFGTKDYYLYGLIVDTRIPDHAEWDER